MAVAVSVVVHLLPVMVHLRPAVVVVDSGVAHPHLATELLHPEAAVVVLAVDVPHPATAHLAPVVDSVVSFQTNILIKKNDLNILYKNPSIHYLPSRLIYRYRAPTSLVE